MPLRRQKQPRPGFVDADFDLAQLDVAEGKLDDARKRLSEVAASHPDNKNAHLLLARFEMTSGKNPEAIEQLKKAVDLMAKTPLRSIRLPTCLPKASNRMKP